MKKAEVVVGIKKNVHSHTMRTSSITHYRSQGILDCEILRLTGHASTQMMNRYDKTSQAENASCIALA